ncbi:MAG: AAA family ATPase [Candidatus Micrarchaeia archaeon]
MQSFLDILQKPTVFADRNVLSPHFVPEALPFREKHLERIMSCMSPALQGVRPRNLFIYGKTGTGKTACVRRVSEKFEALGTRARVAYLNCRTYNSRYKVMQKSLKGLVPEVDKGGFGITYFYEKMLEWVQEGNGRFLVLVLDEVDMVKDLDELIYSLTRSNDEVSKGGVSLIGISNNLSFKDKLDPRSKSSLFESELVFESYNASQLAKILSDRAASGFKPGSLQQSAISLTAAASAHETGDARYALKLLLRAGEIADESNPDPKSLPKITDKEVELARKSIDGELAKDAIKTLPRHQQLVLLSAANLTLNGGRNKYQRLGDAQPGDGSLLSGEVFDEYCHLCREYSLEPKTSRWYREYLLDLEMLGLISLTDSSKGFRGHTRFVRLGFPAAEVVGIIRGNLENNDFGREISEVEG